MTIAGADAEAGETRADLRRETVRSSGTLLLWIGAGLSFAGLAAVVLAWTLLSRTPWAVLIAPGCFAIVAGANFAWWGDRFRHYDPVFPSGAWGAVFAAVCLAVSSVAAVAFLLYVNSWLASVLDWFQSP
jgi:hypothetical protein